MTESPTKHYPQLRGTAGLAGGVSNAAIFLFRTLGQRRKEHQRLPTSDVHQNLFSFIYLGFFFLLVEDFFYPPVLSGEGDEVAERVPLCGRAAKCWISVPCGTLRSALMSADASSKRGGGECSVKRR
ncbi:hypothetical protein CEXT_643881 [Caerostris extrusa]|uniref:Uncharacterized protein n=1 Tax=Caerostris extrusa TaxID=172846 RepID=A0AAV4WKT6_CAEEX|nr:hypothetical protein CEXT_643881 [Caerostris extrusa]